MCDLRRGHASTAELLTIFHSFGLLKSIEHSIVKITAVKKIAMMYKYVRMLYTFVYRLYVRTVYFKQKSIDCYTLFCQF